MRIDTIITLPLRKVMEKVTTGELPHGVYVKAREHSDDLSHRAYNVTAHSVETQMVRPDGDTREVRLGDEVIVNHKMNEFTSSDLFPFSVLAIGFNGEVLTFSPRMSLFRIRKRFKIEIHELSEVKFVYILRTDNSVGAQIWADGQGFTNATLTSKDWDVNE